jgi:hypothetical protein
LRRWALLAFAIIACGCVTLTPAASKVAVYRAPLDGPPAGRAMPEGCRLIKGQQPPENMTELEIEGQKEPFLAARNKAAEDGANTLLVLSQMIVPRRSLNCPTSARITDCAPESGAWFHVAFETYACTPEALAQIEPKPKTP